MDDRTDGGNEDGGKELWDEGLEAALEKLGDEGTDEKVLESVKKELRKKLGRSKVLGRLDKDRLCGLLDEVDSAHSWETEGRLEQLDVGKQAVDVVGEPRGGGGGVVYVELEVRTASRALDNVVKLWRYVAQSGIGSGALLVQILSPRFDWDETGVRRKAEVIFVGGRAEVDTGGKLTYRCVDGEFWPKGGERRAERLVGEVLRVVGDWEN